MIECTGLELTTAMVTALIVAAMVTGSSQAVFPADLAIFMGTGIATFFGVVVMILWVKNDPRR